jgi:hypothetical protein
VVCLVAREYAQSSKPTVWDGDYLFPPCGPQHPSSCSKPTVWDGDRSSKKSPERLTGSSVLSPPCGMETPFEIKLEEGTA